MSTNPFVDVYIHPSAQIIGDVAIGKGSSIWPGVVLRGDDSPISIGENSNIQDNCVIHGKPGIPTVIKDFVSIGHGAIIHSSTIQSHCIIGMGAILLSGSQIGENCIIAAGSVVKENEKIPPRNLAVGVPAKVARPLTDGDIQEIHRNAEEYIKLMAKYKKK